MKAIIALCVLGSVAIFAAADGQTTAIQDQVVVQERTGELSLPAGAQCTVHVVRERQQEEIEGTFLKSSEEWIVLRGRGKEVGVPLLDEVPNKPKLFRNASEKRSATKLWIPRDVVLYVASETVDSGRD